jgi:hypothetical protein
VADVAATGEAGKGLEKACSFLKKRTKRLSILRKRTDPGHGRIVGTSAKSKSLLLLFFRKEDLTF